MYVCLYLCMMFYYRADLDPIYYCELLKECEIKDDGDASILSLSVNPSTVQQGIS